MTFTGVRITTTEASTAVSETLSGVTTLSTVAAAQTYDLVTMSIDVTNNIVSGTKSDGTKVVIEAGKGLSIAFI